MAKRQASGYSLYFCTLLSSFQGAFILNYSIVFIRLLTHHGTLRKLTALFFLTLYLPSIFSGGTCVDLCFANDGSISLEFEHCHGASFSTEGSMNTTHNHFHQDSECTDIPLSIGTMIHIPPESDRDLNVVLSYQKVSSTIHTLTGMYLPALRTFTQTRRHPVYLSFPHTSHHFILLV